MLVGKPQRGAKTLSLSLVAANGDEEGNHRHLMVEFSNSAIFLDSVSNNLAYQFP
jgi:hypothetical protein